MRFDFTKRRKPLSSLCCPYCGLKSLVEWVFMGHLASKSRLYCSECYRFTDMQGRKLRAGKPRVIPPV